MIEKEHMYRDGKNDLRKVKRRERRIWEGSLVFKVYEKI